MEALIDAEPHGESHTLGSGILFVYFPVKQSRCLQKYGELYLRMNITHSRLFHQLEVLRAQDWPEPRVNPHATRALSLAEVLPLSLSLATNIPEPPILTIYHSTLLERCPTTPSSTPVSQ